MARKTTDYVQFKLRIREGLRRRIEREAEKKRTSANAEAVERLEASFEEDGLRDVRKGLERAFQLVDKYKEESASLDREVLKMLVNNKDESAMLLRMIARELSSNPNWAEQKEAFAQRVSGIIKLFDVEY